MAQGALVLAATLLEAAVHGLRAGARGRAFPGRPAWESLCHRPQSGLKITQGFLQTPQCIYIFEGEGRVGEISSSLIILFLCLRPLSPLFKNFA